ncbi:hypothetical protein BDQ17DRAFT_1327308 [Cyathus striatus]|nr:hypothetical protein BDQ17DRAFT_1327308 [Cyathus striatus]
MVEGEEYEWKEGEHGGMRNQDRTRWQDEKNQDKKKRLSITNDRHLDVDPDYTRMLPGEEEEEEEAENVVVACMAMAITTPCQYDNYKNISVKKGRTAKIYVSAPFALFDCLVTPSSDRRPYAPTPRNMRQRLKSLALDKSLGVYTAAEEREFMAKQSSHEAHAVPTAPVIISRITRYRQKREHPYAYALR